MADASADVVYADQILEHMRGIDDARQFTAEALRSLRPGGHFFVVVPNYLKEREFFWDVDYTHNFVTTPRRMQQLLYDGGFEILHLERSIGVSTGLARDVLAAAALFVNVPGVDTLSRYTGTEELLFKIRKNLFETLTFVARKPRVMLLRLAITAAILAYLATRIDMAEAARATAAVSRPHLILVLLMVGLDRAVMILRWVLLLRASGNPISTADATRLFLVSSFVGSFLPAGVGADAARAYGCRARGRSSPAGSEALASVAVDRLLGVVSLVLMAIIGVIAWAPEGRTDWRIAAGIVAALIACVRGVLGERLDAPGSSQRSGTTASSPAACCASPTRWAVIAIAAACCVHVLRLVDRRAGDAHHAGLRARAGARHDGAVHVFPALHAAGPAAAVAADLDQRLRPAAGRDRVDAPADGRAGQPGVCAVDADRVDGLGGQLAWVVLWLGNPVESGHLVRLALTRHRRIQ